MAAVPPPPWYADTHAAGRSVSLFPAPLLHTFQSIRDGTADLVPVPSPGESISVVKK